MKLYNQKNEEILDRTPVSVPLDMKIPESIDQMMQRLINNRFSDLQLDKEYETFEEADDFYCDDDAPDYASPWEEVFDPRTGQSLGFLEQNRYQPKEHFYDNDNFKNYNDIPADKAGREDHRTLEDDGKKTE